MTAELLPFPGDATARADDTIRRTIKGLISGRGLRVEDVAPEVGMTTATFYRRLGGHGRQQAFGAGEVAALAAYFGLEVQELYGGLGGRFTPPDPGTASVPDTRRYLSIISPLSSPSAPVWQGPARFGSDRKVA